MPVIRVSDEVMEILKRFAIPLEDTPDSVLRRVLNDYVRIKKPQKGEEAERPAPAPSQAADADLGKAKQRYAQWIIASLKSQGGRARASEVINHISKTFGHEITETERQPLKSGKPRWIKNINSVRVELVKRGLLNKTEYGVWELTSKSKDTPKGTANAYHKSGSDYERRSN